MTVKLIMMVGLPASGKSHYAKLLSKQHNAKIMSSDSIREELYGNESVQEDSNKVFELLHRRVLDCLKNEENVIYDATNISYKRRKNYLKGIKVPCEKICYFIATPLEKCFDNNIKRDRKVPEYIIENMYKNFYIPQKYEGWDKIEVAYNDNDIGENPLIGLDSINQDNPHHTLTIGQHCKMAAELSIGRTENEVLRLACLYHDVGKKFCKTYNKDKGHCVYYQHHLVSAYETFLFFSNQLYLEDLTMESLLEMVLYITWHMQFYCMQNDKAKNNFIDLIGREKYENLLILHECDKLAH